MKVSELIQRLQEMPQDAEIGHVWDGAMRTFIKFVWLTRDGVVATAPEDMPVYYEEDLPFSPADIGLVCPFDTWRTPDYD